MRLDAGSLVPILPGPRFGRKCQADKLLNRDIRDIRLQRPTLEEEIGLNRLIRFIS